MLFSMCDVSPAPAAGSRKRTSSGDGDTSEEYRAICVKDSFCSPAFSVEGCPVADCTLGAYLGPQKSLCKFYSVPSRLLWPNSVHEQCSMNKRADLGQVGPRDSL